MSEHLAIVYIGGAGRSGSTLLSALLNTGSDCFAAGEATHIWQRGIIEDQLCGCNKPFSCCELWRAILKEAFGRISYQEAIHIERQRRYCLQLAKLPAWIYPNLQSQKFQLARQEYEDALLTLYCAIRKITNCRFIIDSSKYPSEAFLLKSSPKVNLRLVHLVRDCNAVVHAWQKHMLLPEVYWQPRHMAVYNPAVTCSAWVCFNVLFERLRKKLPGKALITRYEDLSRTPVLELNKISATLNIELPNSLLTNSDYSLAADNHMASGNPIRLAEKSLEIQLDSEWEQSISNRQRAFVHCFAGWMQSRYGYPEL